MAMPSHSHSLTPLTSLTPLIHAASVAGNHVVKAGQRRSILAFGRRFCQKNSIFGVQK